MTAQSHFHIAGLFLCPVRIVTWAFTKTHRDESFKNKPSSDCQENIYWWRWLSSPSHPQNDLRLPRACPRSPHTQQNSCWKWVCVTGPLGGSQQGLEAVKSRPLQPWTAPPLSQSQRGKDLNLEWPHQVPDGFIHRPQLRFPSPLNFPALLFFFGPVFPTRPIHFPEKKPPTPHPFLLPVLPSSPSNTTNPPAPSPS